MAEWRCLCFRSLTPRAEEEANQRHLWNIFKQDRYGQWINETRCFIGLPIWQFPISDWLNTHQMETWIQTDRLTEVFFSFYSKITLQGCLSETIITVIPVNRKYFILNAFDVYPIHNSAVQNNVLSLGQLLQKLNSFQVPFSLLWWHSQQWKWALHRSGYWNSCSNLHFK